MSNFEPSQGKRGLGRGLGSLLGGMDEAITPKTPRPSGSREISLESISEPARTPDAASAESRIWMVGIEKIKPNPSQPRKEFEKKKLAELAASIKEKGILQPIVARKSGAAFEIIAGERRWRGAQAAGLHEVPVILRQADDQDALELALIENIQRHDLNPIDEAEAFELLANRFHMTQEKIAERVGKERVTVTNAMRLLELPSEVKNWIKEGALSAGHAKALLGLQDTKQRIEAAKKVVAQKLSVRATESLVRSLLKNKSAPEPLAMDVSKRLVQSLSEELQKALGTKVEIEYSKGKGKLSIHFFSDEELTQLSQRIRQTWKN